MSKRRCYYAASALAVLTLLVAISCGKGEKATPTAPVAQGGQAAMPSPLTKGGYWGSADYERLAAEGKAIYGRVGCAQCHGTDGQGADVGPPLAGHNRRQVLSQVRNPLGAMPAFPPSKLSRQEAELVALYVESLGPVTSGSVAASSITLSSFGSHSHPAYTRSTAPADHLLMAIIGLEYGDPSEGMHHVGHAIQFSDLSPELNRELAGILLDIGNGQFLRAQYQLLSLLAKISPDKGKASPQALHLRLALDSLENGAISAASHLENLLSVAGGENLAQARQVIALLDAGDWTKAYEKLESITP